MDLYQTLGSRQTNVYAKQNKTKQPAFFSALLISGPGFFLTCRSNTCWLSIALLHVCHPRVSPTSNGGKAVIAGEARKNKGSSKCGEEHGRGGGGAHEIIGAIMGTIIPRKFDAGAPCCALWAILLALAAPARTDISCSNTERGDKRRENETNVGFGI